MPLPMTIEIQGDRIRLQRDQWKNNDAYISNYPGLLEEVKKSLEASPIVKKGDYNYFVNPISDGVPSMDPKMLRELALSVHKHAISGFKNM